MSNTKANRPAFSKIRTEYVLVLPLTIYSTVLQKYQLADSGVYCRYSDPSYILRAAVEEA